MQFINLHAQRDRIKKQLDERIQNVLASACFINGPENEELEKKLAEFIGVKHAILVASGTDALLMALMAYGIKEGDEVITSPFSFFASTSTILHLGAKPVFVDINPNTYNIDVNLIEAAITSKTKAIMPISLYGQCPDMDAINAIAKKHNIPVIEDAAQSFGAMYKGKYSGALSEIACTSFYPAKPLACYGDGGACFTDNDELAAKLKIIRNHGQDRTYHHIYLGINGRFDTLQAAVMLAKLEIFPDEIQLRQKIAEKYDAQLKKYVKIPFVESHNTCIYAQYTIQVPNRAELQQFLQQHNIPTAIHYPITINKQPALAQSPEHVLSFPHAEKAASEVISLPMHPYLTADEIDKVAGCVIDFIGSPKG